MIPSSQLTKRQVKTFTKTIGNERLDVKLRYDDECNNGHNTFAATATLYEGKRDIAGGCLHEEIARFFPELEPFLKWHLTSSTSPMHYLANALYHAGDKDCHGRLKGEPYAFERKIMFNNVPFLYKPSTELLKFVDEVGLNANWQEFELIELHHANKAGDYQFKPKLSFSLMPVTEWYKAPFDNWEEARNFVHAMTHCNPEIVKRATQYGEGKERDFNAARDAACWPEATDEQLSLPKPELEKLMQKRLPALMQAFKTDMEKLGFIY